MTRAGSGKHRTEPHPVAARVGARIRQLRKANNISFDAFVGETGLGRGYISELERGLVNPSLGNLDIIAKVLGITLAELVEE